MLVGRLTYLGVDCLVGWLRLKLFLSGMRIDWFSVMLITGVGSGQMFEDSDLGYSSFL